MNEFNQEPIVTDRWTISELEIKRKIADPVADKVVLRMMKDGDKSLFNELFDAMQKNNDSVLHHLPEYLKEYFALRRDLPVWADQTKIALGQQLFAEYGSEISMMLFCKALPQCYACSKGVQVMYKTGRFVEKKDGSFDVFNKRLVETAQFVVNILSPGGFGPTGK